MKKFKGVITPIVTPFKENGEFYEQGMLNLLDFLHRNGVNGVYALGSYGSFPLLSIAERKRIAEFVVTETRKRGMSSIIQIGAPATADSVELALHAVEIQPDAIASVVPFYYSNYAYGEEVYLEHFQTIVDAVDGRLPVQMYNNPKTTGYTVTPSFFRKLIKIGVSGLKDSSANMSLFGELMNIVNAEAPDFDLMPGSASVFLAGFSLGAEACVAGTAMAFPDIVVKLYNAFLAGDIEQAKKLQLQIVQARDYQSVRPLRAAVSYDILKIKGIDIGTSRKPWYRLNEEQYHNLEEQLKRDNLMHV